MARENVDTFDGQQEVLVAILDMWQPNQHFTGLEKPEVVCNGQVAIVGGNEQHFSLGMFTNPLHIGKWLYIPPQPLSIGIKQLKARDVYLIGGAVRETCILGHFSKRHDGLMCDSSKLNSCSHLNMSGHPCQSRNTINYFTAAKKNG